MGISANPALDRRAAFESRFGNDPLAWPMDGWSILQRDEADLAASIANLTLGELTDLHAQEKRGWARTVIGRRYKRGKKRHGAEPGTRRESVTGQNDHLQTTAQHLSKEPDPPATLTECEELYQKLYAPLIARRCTHKQAAASMQVSHRKLCSRLSDLRERENQAVRLAAAATKPEPIMRSTPMITRADYPRLKAEWNAVINVNLQAGMEPGRALSEANRQRPELRRQLVEAANAPNLPAPPKLAPVAVLEFDQAVSQLQERTGMTCVEATRTVCVTNPVLREKYVRAVNQERSAAVA